MPVQFAAEVQFLEPGRIKTGEEHIVDNQEIDGFLLLELVDENLAGLFVTLVVEDKFCSHRLFSRHEAFGGEALVEESQHRTCLGIRFADDHTGNLRCILLNAELADVVDDVVQERIQVVLGLDYLVVVDVRLLDLNVVRQFIQDVLDLLFVFGFYVFAHQAKGIAVSDGLVVVIFVDVVAEHFP